MDKKLAKLIDNLRSCDPSERIGLRDPILAFGAEALIALADLAHREPGLGPSIVAWLEVYGRRETTQRSPTVAVIRELSVGDDEGTARYAKASLERLGAGPQSIAKTRSGLRPIPRTGGTEWQGFQEHEFGRNAGTTWRSAEGRASLAPIITRVLREFDPDFISYGVERLPEIHFAVARRYKGSHDSGVTASKLVVYAHGPTDETPDSERLIAAGWYIERGDGTGTYGSPDDARRWDWPLFLDALERPSFRNLLTEVMRDHDLAFGDYTNGGRYKLSLGWTARIEGEEPVARSEDGQVQATGWEEIAAQLRDAPMTEWLDLHLVRTWPAMEAIEAGQPFAMRAIAPVLADIAPLYLRMLDRAVGSSS